MYPDNPPPSTTPDTTPAESPYPAHWPGPDSSGCSRNTRTLSRARRRLGFRGRSVQLWLRRSCLFVVMIVSNLHNKPGT